MIITVVLVNAIVVIGGAVFVGITLDKSNTTLDALAAASVRSDCRAVLTGRADQNFRDGLTKVFVSLLDPDAVARSTGFSQAVQKLDAAAPLSQHEINRHCGLPPGG